MLKRMLRGRIRVPADLLDRIRWLFLVVTLANLALLFPLVLTSQASLAARCVAAVLIVVLGWWWWRGYRLRGFPAWSSIAEGSALVLISVVPDNPNWIINLPYMAACFRALHGSTGQAAILAPAYAMPYVVPAFLGLQPADLPGILRHVIGFPVAVGIMRTSFNTLKTYKETADALRDARDQLESRVIDRTRELQAEVELHARTSRELQSSEIRYRNLIENAKDLIYSVDLDGRITSVNRSVTELFGYPPEEVVGRHFATFITPESLPLAQAMMERKIEGEGRTVYELTLLAKDGRRVPIEVCSWLRYQDGKPIQSQGIIRDITHRKALEEELRQARKMDAIGELAGGVAHDFNNLLTVIGGFSEMLATELRGTARLSDIANEIKQASDHAATLTGQLLAFGRRQVLQPTVLNINQVLSGMHTMIGRLFGEIIDLKTDYAPDLDAVNADASQVQRVILNMVLNARDAMLSGGTLSVTTRNVRLNAEYCRRHPGLQAGPYVLLAISDTGHGMDARTIEQIFEPFFSTKERGRGTGLGLASAYGIIKQSGGHIAVESVPGQGTTFRIFLPALPAASIPAAPNPIIEKTANNTETILLVEDDPAVRKYAAEVLSMFGYRVLAAANGAAAIAVEEQYHDTIDMLVTDVLMPNMTGPELAERLRPRRPKMRVLFVSGYADQALIKQGLLKPGSYFLSKPFTVSAFGDVLRTILDRPATGSHRLVEPVSGAVLATVH